MNKANECTCPSGDGSLVHPCPAHPAVEQVGGDERAAFEAAFAAMGRPVCRADYDQDAYGTPFDDGGWTGWQARAALAQPYPKSGDYSDQSWINAGCPPEQPEQAEAERPEVVAWQYRVTAGPQTGWSLWHPGKGEEFERSYTVERRPLMTVAQHERIVKAWIERWKAYIELSAKIAAQRDAALARVAELEHSQSFQRDIDYSVLSEYADKHRLHFNNLCAVVRSALIALPAQAQHSVPGNAAALVRAEAKKYSLNAAGMLDSGAPEHAQTFAIVQLLSEFDDEEAESHWEAIMAYSDFRTSDALFRAAELLAAAPGKEGNDD
ncbi:hypothetical protein [Pseudomonas aeruginosa]|uniref:hypothetical protein n=1 Tax=Pseudomonas aeruginosa TaxID=287 RepID=UPI0013EF21B4|nr:hypothetical protein [Pseudomonas aeruginosa]